LSAIGLVDLDTFECDVAGFLKVAARVVKRLHLVAVRGPLADRGKMRDLVALCSETSVGLFDSWP